MPDLIFIGAGPVGLYTAIQAKLYCPDIEIVMFEKYKEYQRKHVLLVDESSHTGAHPDPKFQELLGTLEGAVPTSEMEAKLKEFALNLDIKIQYEEITSAQELAEHYPDAKIIVGSDGSHSLVRKEIFGDKKSVEEDLQYIVELKYTVQGKTRALNKFTEHLPGLTQTNHLVLEHVSKMREGVSHVSLRLFVDHETFDEMKAKGVTFKNPLSLKDAKDVTTENIKKVYNTLIAWIILRQEATGEVMAEGEKITCVNLPVYRAEKFALQNNNQTWCLVGDAGLGVPYFRALNAGFLGSTQLAKLISKEFNPQPRQQATNSFSKISSSLENNETLIEKYNRKMSEIADTEISNARLKKVAVQSGELYADSSRAIPVSKSKLGGNARRRIAAARLPQDDDNDSFLTKSSKDDDSSYSSTSKKTKECLLL